MKIVRVLLAGILVSSVASRSAPAASIVGSLPLGTINAAVTSGSDLSTATDITWTSSVASGSGLGDLSGILTNTSFGVAGDLKLGSLGSFSYDFKSGSTDYGTFTASSVGSLVAMQQPNFLNIYLAGTFTPGAGLPGFTAGPAALLLSFTYSSVGQLVSVSGSAALVGLPGVLGPASTPEPASLALVGIGLVSVAAFRALRRRVGK
jgi:hypothetical protein